MLGRAEIAALIPHQGTMCLLDSALAWDAVQIECRAHSHLDPANPLRSNGRLGMVCGIEYCLQAAALHGALRDRTPAREGRLAALREVAIAAGRLDDPAHGELAVRAKLEHGEGSGAIYRLHLATESGRVLVAGRATIMFPP